MRILFINSERQTRVVTFGAVKKLQFRGLVAETDRIKTKLVVHRTQTRLGFFYTRDIGEG